MVVGAFPAFKLGALVLKQISKPLANLVKSRAKSSPFFRTYVCMPPAQFYHWCEVKMKMWSMNLGKPVKIPPLNENMAIELGAELLGEGIIFAIATGILVFEYERSARKEALKEEEREAEKLRIQAELKELYFARAEQDAQISELIRILRLNIPTATYKPQNIDNSSIPQHHRDGFRVAEQSSTLSTMKGWFWNAVDVILPRIEDEDSRPEAAGRPTVIVQRSDADTSCDCPTPLSLENPKPNVETKDNNNVAQSNVEAKDNNDVTKS